MIVEDNNNLVYLGATGMNMAMRRTCEYRYPGPKIF